MNLKQDLAKNKTIDLYSSSGWKSIFSKVRFWDAPYFEVERLIPSKGLIVDLGCGEGIFSNFLGLSGGKRKILGIEIDRGRLKVADKGIHNVSFKWGDISKIKLPICDAIIIFHVLHHLNSYEEQENVISKCFGQVKKRGKLIIVEVEPGLNFKYLVTWLTDHFIVPILFERRFYSPIYFRSGRRWRDVVEKNGFSCSIINARKGHPFTHVIIECKKL